MIVFSALMIWKSLMVVTSSESPVVVVLSGSMEPAFHRGDILFLHMGFTPFRSGDIVVFKVADREIPIVHRIIKVHEKEDGTVDLLTKGDNNAVDDRGLYAASQSWIHREHVIGRAKGCASERGTPCRLRPQSSRSCQWLNPAMVVQWRPNGGLARGTLRKPLLQQRPELTS